MNHKRTLELYAEELVHHHADYDADGYSLNLCDLSDSDQNELARLYVEYTDRDLCECVNGNDLSINNDYTCALLAMLQNDCHETRERFADITRKNIITYYKSQLQDVLNDACNDYLLHVNNENGLYAYIDTEHGDVVWR
ncbi:MAG TPA: hypothetical protein VGJ00_10395 [Rhabdochlamydiaceae bacterium]